MSENSLIYIIVLGYFSLSCYYLFFISIAVVNFILRYFTIIFEANFIIIFYIFSNLRAP